MTPGTLLTVMLLWGADDGLYLVDAFDSPGECWSALSASGTDGMCVSEPPPVQMQRPMARPDDLCRAPCVALRPQGRME